MAVITLSVFINDVLRGAGAAAVAPTTNQRQFFKKVLDFFITFENLFLCISTEIYGHLLVFFTFRCTNLYVYMYSQYTGTRHSLSSTFSLNAKPGYVRGFHRLLTLPHTRNLFINSGRAQLDM